MANSGKLHRHLPALALLSVAFIWGFTFPLGKYVVERMPLFTYLAIRFFIASALLLPFVFKRLQKTSGREIIISSVIGLMLFAAFAFQTMGLKYTTAAKASFANGLYVVLTPILYFLIFRTPLRKTAIGAAVLATAGVAMLGGDLSGLTDWDFGVTLVIISTLFTALQIVGVGRYAVSFDTTTLTFLQTVAVAVGCLIAALLYESWNWQVDASVWAAIISMAVLATVVAYFVQCRVQREIDHTVTAVIMSLESVFGALLSWIFLDESFSLTMIIGCALLFAAMLIAQIQPQRDGN